MHRDCKERFLILTILLTTIVCGSESQNCAIPRVVTLSRHDTLRTECAQNGTVLAKISAYHIESILNVTENPLDFIQFKLEDESLLLEVNRSFCTDLFEVSDRNKTHIDETWRKKVELQVEFQCNDGRSKIVTFIIPVTDENTEKPYFEYPIYNLTIEPCVNGTHQKSCPLNFEFPIVVLDDDRDEINACMDFNFSKIPNELIKISTSDLVTGCSLKSLDKQFRCRQMNVHLYLIESDYFKYGDSLSFELLAFNKKKPPIGDNLYGKTTISLKFGSTVVEEPLNFLGAPIFTSNAYYTKVTSFVGNELGLELKKIEPCNVSATIPKTAEGESTGKVRYAMDSEIFSIDSQTGEVSYVVDITKKTDFEFWNKVEVYEIRAALESYGFLNSSVPLVVFFNIQEGSGTESPQECSTEIPVATECPIFYPPTESSTCPVVTCPTPKPCLISTTTDDQNNETTDPSETSTNSDSNATTSKMTTTPWYTSPDMTTASNSFETSSPSPTKSTDIMSSTSTLDPTYTTPSSDSTSTTETPNSSSSSSTSTTTEEETSITMPTYTTTSSTTDGETTVGDTTSSPTFDSSTTEEFISTTPKQDDSYCCGNSNLIGNNFTCPSLEELNETLLPDPFDCAVYHYCRDDGRGGVIDTPLVCPAGLIFCPKSEVCEYQSECCAGCKNCQCDQQTCKLSSDPTNICKGNEYEEDPKFCNVFHQCFNNSGSGQNDCQLECPPTTVWCPEIQNCEYPSICPCNGKINRPPLCNLCECMKSGNKRNDKFHLILF